MSETDSDLDLEHQKEIRGLLKEGFNAVNEDKNTPLILSIKYDMPEIYLPLIRHPQVNIDQQGEYGRTAVTNAMIMFDDLAIKRLVDQGANLNIPDIEGHTTMYYLNGTIQEVLEAIENKKELKKTAEGVANQIAKISEEIHELIIAPL